MNPNDFTSLMPSLGAAANGIFGFFGDPSTPTNAGPSPGGTQNGVTGTTNPGSSTDSWLSTLIQTANAVVPVWTAAVAKQQQQNQVSNPVFAGIGSSPGLTSGGGPVAPGPQSPGGTPQLTKGFFSSGFAMPLLIVGGIALVVFLILK